MQPFRIEPAGPAAAYKTYSVRSPVSTHFRPATCAEVECPAYAYGWKTAVDVSTDLGAQQANYIRMHSGRSFTVAQDGNLVTFTFPFGQNCFAEHRMRLDREAFYRVRNGDWRGNPLGGQTEHVNAEDWIDDFANHQIKLAERAERG